MSKTDLRVLSGLIALTGLFLLFCNQPPDVPERPRGPSRIVKGMATRCTTETPGQRQEVSYQFDWGDGTMSAWSGPCPSNTSLCDTHTFRSTGPVSIRARAQNARGRMSDWSDPLRLNAISGDTVVKWTYGYIFGEICDSVDFFGSVAASPDGRYVYAVDDEAAALHILSREGVRVGMWCQPSGDGFAASPAIGPADECYLSPGPRGAAICAALPSGTLTWQWPYPDISISAPAVSSSGIVYVVCDQDSLYALDRGTAIWVQPIGDDSVFGDMYPPVISLDGSLVIVINQLRLRAFRTSDGSLAWSVSVSRNVTCSPVIGPDGSVIVVDGYGQGYNRLTVLSPIDGSEFWHFDLGDQAFASPIVGPDGVVYVATDNGTLQAIDPVTHSLKWAITLGGFDVSTPALTETGVLYVSYQNSSTEWGGLAAIDCGDGSVRGEIEVPKPCAVSETEYDAAPLIGPDGAVYLGGEFAVVAIWGDGPPPKTGWPQYRHDWCRSGNASWQPGAN